MPPKVEYELSKTHRGPFDARQSASSFGRATSGSRPVPRVVFEASESGASGGVVDGHGSLETVLAEPVFDALGHSRLVFEMPTTASQVALMALWALRRGGKRQAR